MSGPYLSGDRVACTRSLQFGNELTLPAGSNGTVQSSAPIRSAVKFDDDPNSLERLVANSDLEASPG